MSASSAWKPARPPAPASPDSSFTIGKVKGKRLRLTLPGAGQVHVADAAAKAKHRRLKPSTVSARAAGELHVALKFNRKGKRLLRRNDKVKVKVAITFTPTGGTANTQDKRLKVKSAKRQ